MIWIAERGCRMVMLFGSERLLTCCMENMAPSSLRCGKKSEKQKASSYMVSTGCSKVIQLGHR